MMNGLNPGETRIMVEWCDRRGLASAQVVVDQNGALTWATPPTTIAVGEVIGSAIAKVNQLQLDGDQYAARMRRIREAE